jgi:hypothetical protein
VPPPPCAQAASSSSSLAPSGGGAPRPAATLSAAAAADALAAAGRSPGSVAPDFAAAMAQGRVSSELLQRYLDLESRFLVGWLMNFSGAAAGEGGRGLKGMEMAVGREAMEAGGGRRLGKRLMAALSGSLKPRPHRPPGFRERFLADPSFLVKLGIEVRGVGGGASRAEGSALDCAGPLQPPPSRRPGAPSPAAPPPAARSASACAPR